MGPLQYMVVGYERQHFKDDVLSQLYSLSRHKVIRVVDAVFVKRDGRGRLTSQELAKAFPDEDRLINSKGYNEWFTQEDIDAVGARLPNGSAVACLLIEHVWAVRLEGIVRAADEFIGGAEQAGPLAAELEQMLAASPSRAASALVG